MPLMSLAATSLDVTKPDPPAARTRILKYLETDTLCFPLAEDMEDPEARKLAEAQAQCWSPYRYVAIYECI